MQGRVAVSHAFALGTIKPRLFEEIAGELARAEVAIMTSCPPAAPVPRLKALRERGVTVFGGSDNIRDCWCRAIELLFADAIGEKIDQARDVGLGFLDQARGRLFRRQRFRHGRRECHDLDAEAGIDGLDLVAEQPGHALCVAQRQAGSDPHGLGAIVDAMADEIEPPRAEALLLQGVAELGRELADIARDGLRRADRFGEGAANLDQLLERIGSIGSAIRPVAWSRRRPSSGPKRNASGARGCANRSPTRSKPSTRRPSTRSGASRRARSARG